MRLAGTLARTAIAPFRLGLSAGELGLEVALGLTRGTRRALEGDHELDVRPTHPSWPPARMPRRHPEPVEPPPPVQPPPPVPPAAADGDAVPVIPLPPGAKQVEDSPEPVAEFAEEGAEAEVHVDPPWDGYDDMTAAQIAERLADADQAAVAAVSLYEGMRRARRSVVRAADRRLRLLSA